MHTIIMAYPHAKIYNVDNNFELISYVTHFAGGSVGREPKSSLF